MIWYIKTRNLLDTNSSSKFLVFIYQIFAVWERIEANSLWVQLEEKRRKGHFTFQHLKQRGIKTMESRTWLRLIHTCLCKCHVSWIKEGKHWSSHWNLVVQCSDSYCSSVSNYRWRNTHTEPAKLSRVGRDTWVTYPPAWACRGQMDRRCWSGAGVGPASSVSVHPLLPWLELNSVRRLLVSQWKAPNASRPPH